MDSYITARLIRRLADECKQVICFRIPLSPARPAPIVVDFLSRLLVHACDVPQVVIEIVDVAAKTLFFALCTFCGLRIRVWFLSDRSIETHYGALLTRSAQPMIVQGNSNPNRKHDMDGFREHRTISTAFGEGPQLHTFFACPIV